MLKFHAKGQIPRLGLKFHSLWKTVGPNDKFLKGNAMTELRGVICHMGSHNG